MHWSGVMAKARVPETHRSTASRSMQAAGIDVKWRAAREKPMRSKADEDERRRVANRMRKLPPAFWQRRVDLYMDNKVWPIPMTDRGKRFLKMVKVRGNLRTRSEGLQDGFTKPSAKTHKVNTGGSATLCACIIGGKVRVWQYLPFRWCADEAVRLYRGVKYPALRKHRRAKRRYTLLEDNDPTGYKSNAATAAKRNLGIEPIEFPAYSPDLNPLDFGLWDEAEARMSAQQAARGEAAEQYEARLHRTAMRIPERVIRKILASIRGRAEAVYAHRSGHTPRD